MNSEKILDISWGTIFKIAVAALVFYILYLVKDIIIWFVFALVISILLNPVIDLLQKKKVPRAMAVILVYFGIFGIITLIIYISASFLIAEIQQFIQFFPRYLDQVSPFFLGLGVPIFSDIESLVKNFGVGLEKAISGVGSALFAIFGGIVSTLFVITTAIFISLEHKFAEKSLSLFFPQRYETSVLTIWQRSQKKVSGWFLTRVLASLFVAVLSFLVFVVFDTQYKFSLALIAGLFNFIPFVGAVFGGLVIFLVASFDSLLKSIFVVVAFTVIQQIENNVFTPLISRKIMDIPPLLVLISLAVGGELWGLIGAIIFVPLAGILFEFFREFLQKRKAQEGSASE